MRFLCLLGLLAGSALAQGVPAGYVLFDGSKSPDGRYGVIVPQRDGPEGMESVRGRDKVVVVATGQVVASLQGNPGYELRANHVETMPARWSADGEFLLWEVGGKWSPWALGLVHIAQGQAAWQLDLLATAQQEALARTRQAAPDRYAAEKKRNAGNGAAFPDGFTVDVSVKGADGSPLVFPLEIHADLTSNPKQIDADLKIELDSQLDAVVDRDGKFRVTAFHLGTTPDAAEH